MAGLPPVATEDAFTAVCQDEAALRPGVERLCQQLGVGVSELTRYAAGSRPVYAAGDLVLKLFPPVATWPGYRVEAEVLTAVQGKLPTPTPQVHAAGEHDGWGYVEGNARFLTQTLTTYGYRRDQLGADLRRRLLAWGILHRYSNLTCWMRRLPEPDRPTLDALADCWFITE
jgi:hypothetical protein